MLFSLGLAVFAAMFFILVLVILIMGFKSVPQGFEYTVERLGRYTRSLKPGPNLIVPFLDNITNKIDMREQILDIEPQQIITKDNVEVIVDCIVYYQVIDSAKATYGITNLEEAMRTLTMANVRAATGEYELDTLFSAREAVGDSLNQGLDDATSVWGVKILRVKIEDIKPPQELQEAMTQQMRAERERRALVARAEGEREAAIKIADGQRLAAIAKAQGDRDAMILRAEGQSIADIKQAEAKKQATILEAEARIDQARAEAEATAALSKSIQEGSIQALNYFMAEKYMQALSALAAADNQKVILMPLEASQVIGALGGITELAKEAFPSKQLTEK